MYGSSKFEGNQEGNFNILEGNFGLRKERKGFFVLGKWKH
jgi:hypothetical protein